ncbi:hypothetical protein B0H19DRAFT_1373989 [Mycena capillaripes]|nr:hypothetical protein B0H19DRAFT_1373989 [Mycena capillaripes]
MNAHANQTLITLIQGSLVEIMMRDGAMYFGIIVLANLANVGTLYPGDHPHVWTTSYVRSDPYPFHPPLSLSPPSHHKNPDQPRAPRLSVTRISRLIIGYTTGLTQKHHTDGRYHNFSTVALKFVPAGLHMGRKDGINTPSWVLWRRKPPFWKSKMPFFVHDVYEDYYDIPLTPN